MPKILVLTKKSLLSIAKYVAKEIIKGKVIAIPTDTTYGLAANARNKAAVERIFYIKKRIPTSPLSVFLATRRNIYDYAIVNELANKILDLFPDKITIIFRAKRNTGLIPQKIIYNGTIGIRIPRFLFPRLIARYAKTPITATSANIHGKPPIYKPEKLLSLDPDLIVDFGELPQKKPSTIIDVSSGTTIKIIREGSITLKKLKRIMQITSKHR